MLLLALFVSVVKMCDGNARPLTDRSRSQRNMHLRVARNTVDVVVVAAIVVVIFIPIVCCSYRRYVHGSRNQCVITRLMAVNSKGTQTDKKICKNLLRVQFSPGILDNHLYTTIRQLCLLQRQRDRRFGSHQIRQFSDTNMV